jgi:hypothetical protein
MPLLVTLADGREAWVSQHARDRARRRIGRGWLARLAAAFRGRCQPGAVAYIAEDGATFVAVDGEGDGLVIVTAYMDRPLLEVTDG